MGARLSGIEACVFDAYGTLFDLASATNAHASALGDRLGPLAQIWRQKQLEYTWLRSLMGAYAGFWEVTGEALDFALQQVGLGDDERLRAALMDSYLTLAAYPEVPALLAQLSAAGLRCAILSNGSPAMLDAALESCGLTEAFVAVLSVDSVGIYKPHHSVYQLAADTLGLAPERICFISANGWDAAGAAQFGFGVVWVNRTGAIRERLPTAPAAELRSLAALPGLLGVQAAQA